jgi:integrase/recombinase XerD
MGRRFIAERGGNALTNDHLSNIVRNISNVRYSFEEAIETFIKAKEAEGLRKNTINGYHDTVRYFREWIGNETMCCFIHV